MRRSPRPTSSKFLYSDEAQKIFGENGYRPVVKSVADQFDYKTPATLFTIQDFGGWGTVKDEFFDPENGIVAKIEMSLGVSTDSGWPKRSAYRFVEPRPGVPPSDGAS